MAEVQETFFILEHRQYTDSGNCITTRINTNKSKEALMFIIQTKDSDVFKNQNIKNNLPVMYKDKNFLHRAKKEHFVIRSHTNHYKA